MAEFQEVMRQIGRLCAVSPCSEDCPLKSECVHLSQAADSIHAERIERIVMKWAAEHPEHSEPVYPTWHEWLSTTPFIEKVKCGNGTYKVFNWKQPIPDDIAEKLGIELKER